jgi:hypothetical protein
MANQMNCLKPISSSANSYFFGHETTPSHRLNLSIKEDWQDFGRLCINRIRSHTPGTASKQE